ncbi:MAG: aspartate/glutamate racemase family protein [Bacteroidales bacterium]
MKILVVNPNTSSSMTERLRRELENVRAVDTQLTVINPLEGPLAIETSDDEARAIPSLLALLAEEAPRHDGALIACFSDPGLDAARERVAIPVVGLMESSVQAAAMLGRFTILTSRRARVPDKMAHVARLGLSARLASVRPLEMGVLEMDAQPGVAHERILEVGSAAVRGDGAQVIVLGCAGLAGHAASVGAALGVPVVDPGPVALATAEMLVRLAKWGRA